MGSIPFALILVFFFFRCDAKFSKEIESLSVHPLVTPKTTGTTFVFAFLSSHNSVNAIENLSVLVSNQDPTQTAQITITSPYPGFQTITTNVGPLNVTRISILPVDLQTQFPSNVSTATTIENKGLQLVSTLPVSVYIDNEGGSIPGVSSDSMLILPTCQLSTHYETFGDESGFQTLRVFSMVALQDNTMIRFSNAPGSFRNFTLNTLQVLTFSHSTIYQTGVEVEASAPIAAISGTVCGIGIYNYPVCDHETIMLVPEESWGTKFPYVTFAGTIANEFLMNANQLTNVYRDSILIGTLPADSYIRFNYGTNYITTDKPVEVLQVGRRTTHFDTQTGAVFFVHLPPVEQFITGPVQFSTNANLANNTQHYVRITTFLASIGTISIDGTTPSALMYTRVGRNTVYFYNMRIMPGTHTVTPASSTTTYSAVVYGYGDSTGYGFVAGLNLPATNGACTSARYGHLI